MSEKTITLEPTQNGGTKGDRKGFYGKPEKKLSLPVNTSPSEIGPMHNRDLTTIGVKVSRFMSAKIKYTDEPIGPLKVVPDFLPAPEELVFKGDTVKVTIALSKESVEFFKQEAEKHHTQYQKMIRRLLDVYTLAHKQSLTKRSSRRKKRAAER